MKFITRIALLSAVVLLGAPAIASAQMRYPVRFTAPFAFQVGHRLLPAGEYVLAPLSNDQYAFTLSNGKQSVMFMKGDGLGRNPDPKWSSSSDLVVFERGDNHYVLCQVWDSGEQLGVQMSGTYGLTKEAARQERHGSPDNVMIPAAPAPGRRYALKGHPR
jgi:hypothetical protein